MINIKNNKNFFNILLFFLPISILWLMADYTLFNIFYLLAFLLLPGFLFLLIIDKNITNKKIYLLTSIGLSIVFMEILTLFIDMIADISNYDEPLNRNLLIISMIFFIIIETIILKIKKTDPPAIVLKRINIDTSFSILFFLSILLLLTFFNFYFPLPFIFPLLILLIVPGLIFIYYRKNVNYLPLIIFIIGSIFILIFSMRSEYIIGKDIFNEYWHYRIIDTNSDWFILFSGESLLSGSLSINLLPVIFKRITQFDDQTIFKYLIPLIFNLSGIAVFYISNLFVDKKKSLLTSILFYSAPAFLISPWNPRTTLAIFFIGIIFLNFLYLRDKGTNNIIFFILSFGLITSHYSSSYIFLFILVIVIVTNSILRLNIKIITVRSLIIFLMILYIWYTLISIKSLESGIGTFYEIFLNINRVFFSESKSDEVITATTGTGLNNEILSYLHMSISWTIVIIFSLTTLYLLYKSRTKDINHKIIALLSFSILIILTSVTILPQISILYDLQRTYLLGSLIIPLTFIIGFRTFLKNRFWIVCLGIISINLLFKVGLIYYYTDGDKSLQLSDDDDEINRYYVIMEQDYYCMKWYDSHKDNNRSIFSDRIAIFTLSNSINENTSYDGLSNQLNASNYYTIDGYYFLDHNNVEGYIRGGSRGFYSLTNITQFLSEKRNLIYNNKESNIWI